MNTYNNGMNTMVNISKEVRDLTIEQLGTVLYHIANSTALSLDYTDRFKREVLNRASNILCDVESIDVSIADMLMKHWV